MTSTVLTGDALAAALAHGEHSAPGGAASWWPCGAPDWVLVAVLVLAAVAYPMAVAQRARRTCRTWSRWRTASWLLGVALVAAAVSPPLAAWAHHDPRGHMVQHLLLGMYAPLALVLAAPVTVLLGASPGSVRRRVGAVMASRVVHVVAHPVTAGLISVGGLSVLYLTDLYALSLRSTALHTLVNVHFVLAGALFAWAVAGPDPAPRRPGTATRVGALLVSAAAHAVLAKVLYARAGTLPPGTTQDVTQMQQAAQWMYYGGDLAEVLLAAALFATWYRTRSRVLTRGATRPVAGSDSGPRRA